MVGTLKVRRRSDGGPTGDHRLPHADVQALALNGQRPGLTSGGRAIGFGNQHMAFVGEFPSSVWIEGALR